MIEAFLLESDVLNNDEIFNRYYITMSQYRKNKIDSLKKRSDKNLSLAVGIIIQDYLKQLNLSEQKISYSTKANGKPFFTDYSNLHFNASHSGNIALCVFSDSEIGCDIQRLTNANKNIAKRYFTQQEYDFIFNNINPNEAFTRVWSIKEAFLKLEGTGLGGGLSNVDVLVDIDAVKINNSDVSISEYKFQDYYIAICSYQGEATKEIKIIFV
ncbi:MAG: 4'-phosphopantetheinyl transferase superfamily protein [Acutalibacteraceae bacterium]|nr:4'-phosphopantetheinyl transferase superfamily protein [Acutalibacteraceae bacterium]